jgi:hypothetical protein
MNSPGKVAKSLSRIFSLICGSMCGAGAQGGDTEEFEHYCIRCNSKVATKLPAEEVAETFGPKSA